MSCTSFLDDVLESLRRRRRALGRGGWELKIDRIVEREDGIETAKIEVDCVKTRRLSVRLHVWEDRWIWVDARQGSKIDGWLWDFSDQGRLRGDLGGRDLVVGLEKSIDATFEMTPKRLHRFHAVWSELLARGPREVLNV